MKKQILIEDYYGHKLEVTIDNASGKIEFIPDEAKAEIFEQLQTNQHNGTFNTTDHNEEVLSGAWRILELRHDVLYRLLCWQYEEAKEDFISVDIFKEHFGNALGRHYFEKWEKTFKRDINQMIWYFGTDYESGQKFLAMLQSEMEDYESMKNKKNE